MAQRFKYVNGERVPMSDDEVAQLEAEFLEEKRRRFREQKRRRAEIMQAREDAQAISAALNLPFARIVNAIRHGLEVVPDNPRDPDQ